MSLQLLAQLAAIGRVPGATELPPLGNTDRATASAVDTYLRRRQVWAALKAECEAAGGGLTVYSFRHGYALRAHETGLMPRATAALMGHSQQTHSNYGQWTDSETIAAAVARTTAAQQLRHSSSNLCFMTRPIISSYVSRLILKEANFLHFCLMSHFRSTATPLLSRPNQPRQV